jgi:hypothetical protein
MGAISADGRSRFEHSKDQVREQAAQFSSQGFEMGMYIFSHRHPSCDDIELKVPMSGATWGAENAIQNALIPLSPHGPTPLTKTIKEAAQYIKDNRWTGVQVVVVSDGGDTCGGDAAGAAADLYATTGSTISIIGMDMNLHDAAEMANVSRAGNGSFRAEYTGTGMGGRVGPARLFQPGASPALSQPRNPAPSNRVAPGSYSRGIHNPQPQPTSDPAHGREGAPDDSKPIVDPNSIPRVVSFDKTPPPSDASEEPLEPPPVPPPPPPPTPPQPKQPPAPQPTPKPTEPELETSKPMLL